MFQPTKKQTLSGIAYFLVFHMILLPPIVFQLLRIFFSGNRIMPIFQFALILITTCFYLFLFRQPLKQGLRKLGKLVPSLLWRVPVGYIVVLVLRAVIMVVIVHYYGEPNLGLNQDAVENIAMQAPLLIAFLAIVLAPLWEELLFTGLIFGSLQRRSRLIAYVVASLGFGLLHTWPMFIGGFSTLSILITLIYVPSALVSCRLYEKTDNLWSPIIFHSFSNAVAFLTMAMV